MVTWEMIDTGIRLKQVAHQMGDEASTWIALFLAKVENMRRLYP